MPDDDIGGVKYPRIKLAKPFVPEKLKPLVGLNLIYLASPYTKYKFGRAEAALHAGDYLAALISRGFRAHSPIVHSHEAARHGRLDALDPDLWEWHNRGYIEVCDACIVATMPGWEDSDGVRHEIAEFMAAGKPVAYVSLEDL